MITHKAEGTRSPSIQRILFFDCFGTNSLTFFAAENASSISPQSDLETNNKLQTNPYLRRRRSAKISGTIFSDSVGVLDE